MRPLFVFSFDNNPFIFEGMPTIGKSCTSSFSGVYFSCGMVEFSKRFVRFEEPQRLTIKATYHYFQVEYELLTLISTWRVFCLVCDSLLVKIL